MDTPSRAFTPLPPLDPTMEAEANHYWSYHGLDRLLACKAPVTASEDEDGFIAVHQICELAFHQMLLDLPRALTALEAVFPSTAPTPLLPALPCAALEDALYFLRRGNRFWRTVNATLPILGDLRAFVELREALGFPPEAMGTYLALTGDASDGIAGVPGVGAKTAARLCARFSDLPSLYGALQAEGPEALGSLAGAAGIASKLLRGREAAFHAFTLTRLSGAVPRRFDPAAKALPLLTEARLEKAFHAGGLVGYAL